MAQPPLHLIIGNYNTSSWSLRAWLVLRLARLAFIETRIPLRRPETPERIGQHSPSGKLPVLLAEGVPIWDSLAIAEFIAELEPGIWPLDPIARAEARAISAEVHSGFADLRRLMPMDIVSRFAAPGRLPRGLTSDIRRVMSIWEHCRARFAAHGPFLFGAFSITDAMMAPIATRLVTHGVPLAGAVEDYVESVLAWPDMVAWCDAAAAEQAEREAEGALGVSSITRPGRILGPEPAPGPARVPEAGAMVPVDAPAAEAATTAAPLAATTALETEITTTMPASVAPVAETLAAEAQTLETPATAPATTEERVDRHPPAVAREAAEAPPAIAAEPPPPPRRRLFEAAPPAVTEAPAQPPAAATADERLGRAAAPDPEERDADLARPAGRKLGWLRHGVPADHFQEPERRYRRAAAEAPEAADDRPAAPEDATFPEASRREGRPPSAADEDSSSDSVTARPREQQRPAAPAIKPIGGGILRRR